MARCLLHHRHLPGECGIVFASFKGSQSPLRYQAALVSCRCGGHEISWAVQAEAEADAAGLHLAWGTAIFLAVVFVMVVKPSGLWSAVVIAAVGLLGALSGFPFSRLTRTGRRALLRVMLRVMEVSGAGT